MKVLVDTSVWVEYFRNGHPALPPLMALDAVLGHPYVLAELACGTPPAPRAALGDLVHLRIERICDAIYDVTMIRLVIDTDVMVAAFQSDAGASRQLLLDALDRHYALLLSVPLILEYETVLTRPRHLAAAGIDTIDVMAVLDEIAGLCVPVVFDYRWRPTGADQDDELVMETAINGRADMIATFNTRHMQHACRPFGILAQRPAHTLRRIRT